MKRYAPPGSGHARKAPLVALALVAPHVLTPAAHVYLVAGGTKAETGGFAKLRQALAEPRHVVDFRDERVFSALPLDHSHGPACVCLSCSVAHGRTKVLDDAKAAIDASWRGGNEDLGSRLIVDDETAAKLVAGASS